jgi:hypothetical protein
MKSLIRVSAVLVAMGNLYVLTIGGNPAALTSIDWSEVWLVETIAIVTGLIAALVTAEVLLRWARPALEGGFLLRYAVIVLSVGLGGFLNGALAPFGILFDGSFSIPERVLLLVGAGSVAALLGGMIGLAEGLIVALPLAIILGLFKRGDRPHPS